MDSKQSKKILELIENGQIPIREDCVLHGNRLTKLETFVETTQYKVDGIIEKAIKTENQVDDLHKILYRNGFLNQLHQMEIQTTMALERTNMNNKLIWAVLSAIIISTVTILIKGIK